MWPFNRPSRNAAHEALDITPTVHNSLGRTIHVKDGKLVDDPITPVFDPREDATVMEAINTIAETGAAEAEAKRSDMMEHAITARDTSMPEYHSDLASRMVAQLTDRIDRRENDISALTAAYEADRLERERDYREKRAAMEAELTGLKTSLTFYAAAPKYLTPVHIDECSANGAGGHSFNSRGPDGALQCDYCGQAAVMPPNVEPPAPAVLPTTRKRAYLKKTPRTMPPVLDGSDKAS